MNINRLIGLMRSRGCTVVNLPGCAYHVKLPGQRFLVMSLEDLKDAGTAYLQGLGVRV